MDPESRTFREIINFQEHSFGPAEPYLSFERWLDECSEKCPSLCDWCNRFPVKTSLSRIEMLGNEILVEGYLDPALSADSRHESAHQDQQELTQQSTATQERKTSCRCKSDS